MVTLLSTRLTLRPFRPADWPVVAAYRNDPVSARFQSWTVPYPDESAKTIVAELAAMDGPVVDEWFGLVIEADGQMVGDVAIHLEEAGKNVEIGYTLAPAARGRGYATEAAGRTIEWLFDDVGVHRVRAALHPENFDSMRVLERLGFVYEGTDRQSYWVGDDCTDDPRFGLLRSDWTAWRSRPRHQPADVHLDEITWRNRAEVFKLAVHRSQERFVSSVPKSFADALIVDDDPTGHPVIPWFRAIVADGEIAGFVMIAEPTPGHPNPYLWRLLIDRRHQRRGIGTRVLDLVVARCRAGGHRRLEVSYVDEAGGPAPLYLGYGFVPTGEIDEGETVAALDLS
jgi:RimJ/RimL family protein N-acetyltransferase